MRFSMIAAAMLALTGAGLTAPAAVARPVAGKAAPAVGRVPLTIATAHGRRLFHVEVARSDAAQERGLMFREKLAPDGGMIFPFGPARNATFWMKNTVIPLDLVFIRADGTIARIAAGATPYSLDPIDSGEPVVAVLEIAGGRAAALGIAAGDVVRWRG